jgi:DNA polymerase-1
MDRKRLVILDGYALLYRAFFATRYLSTSDGKPTNALFGFTSMLFLLLEKVRPHCILVALDAPGKTFRHAEYEAYKGTRKETAEELKVQLVEARNLVAALGIPSIECVGFEADDVVGTISKDAASHGYDTTIVTGDLDSLQLVDEHVHVLTPGRGITETVTYDIDAVIERYGFKPEFVPDFKALKGDTSDNIPGVPGIGDKGAAELIQDFGTVEAMLERFDELPEKYRKRIAGNEEQMRKSKHLATIVREAPVSFDFKPFALSAAEVAKAVAMLDSFEFRSLVKRAPNVLGMYSGDEVSTAPVIEVQAENIKAELRAVADFATLSSAVGDRPYALFVASAPAKDLFEQGARSAYVALGSDVMECDAALAMRLLAERPATAILHDAKPLYHELPLGTQAPAFDTLLAAYVLRSDRSSYPLRDLTQSYLDANPPGTPHEMAAALYQLAPVLTDRLERENQLGVLKDIELAILPILSEMEMLGIRVDKEQLREFSKELEVAIERLTGHIYELAGQTFTIGSPKQLGEILFEKLQLPGAQKTKTGYATGAEVLGLLAAEHEIAAEVLNWRELTKLKSTYADSLQTLIREDGRIHTTYSQATAATGRLSSNDPNLQNIPIRTELGRSIRKAFIAETGYQLAGLDYSQIELRVLAHMCEEKALVDAFHRREDVHTVTAQLMFGLGQGQATKEQRRLAKMLNYAVLYGVTEYGLAQQLGPQFSISEAKELIRLYNERFPTVKDFTNSVIAEAKSKGFTVTLKGRRRYHPDIHAARINDRKYAERQAMNAPIQGTAADMIKLAMVDVKKQLAGRKTRMLLNVHDELVYELADQDHDLLPSLRTKMEEALPLNVPVEVDVKVGTNWNDMTVQP